MRVKAKVTATRLHIRKGPGITYSKLGHRKNGETLIITKKKVLSNGEVWYKEENKNKWSCAKTSSGKVYIKVIKDLEGKNKSKKTDGKGKKNNSKGGTKNTKSNTDKPRTTGKTIKDVKANIGTGIPKEKTKGATNPIRFSKAKSKSASNTPDDITLTDDGNLAGVYNRHGFFMYTSTNFPKIKGTRSDGYVIGSAEHLLDKDSLFAKAINGDAFNGKYKNWIFTGVRDGRAYLTDPSSITSIDYTLNACKTKTDKDNLNTIHRNVNVSVGTSRATLNKHTYLDFNRFKIQYPDVMLKNAIGVMFFTRPDLNIMSDTSSGTKKASWYIASQIKRDTRDYYIMLQNPAIGGLLTQRGGNVKLLKYHNFNPLLSNQAQGIEVVDDSVDLLEYGQTYTGYRMHYSKSSTKSKAAGTLNIKFKETFDLGITNLHQVWVDYQSNVYKGIFKPKSSHIWAKELDYACNIYYFLLDADMETILFWTKYYGCFPSNVPKSTFSYDFGSNIQFPEVSVTYNYIYKSDLDSQALVEFNQDGGAGKLPFKYAPIGVKSGKGYDTSAYSWVGVPYISTYRDTENDTLLNHMYHDDLRKSDKLRLRYRDPGYTTEINITNTHHVSVSDTKKNNKTSNKSNKNNKVSNKTNKKNNSNKNKLVSSVVKTRNGVSTLTESIGNGGYLMGDFINSQSNTGGSVGDFMNAHSSIHRGILGNPFNSRTATENIIKYAMEAHKNIRPNNTESGAVKQSGHGTLKNKY